MVYHKHVTVLKQETTLTLIQERSMKLFAAIFVVAVPYFVMLPTPPTHCDFKCTDLDLPTCATNGRCFLRFTGKCALEKYNCRNPQKAFRQIDEYRCGEDSAPKCQIGDY